MKNKTLKVLLLGGFYLQTILPGFGSIGPSFLSCLPPRVLRSARENLHDRCCDEFDDFLRNVCDELYRLRNINEYVLIDPSASEYCQKYSQEREESCYNWVKDTVDAEGIESDADAVKRFYKYIQAEYNERLNRGMRVHVRENGFKEAKQKSDAIINGQTDLESLNKLLESIHDFMDREGPDSEALMVYWLLRETPEKKPVIAIILEEWQRQKGLESWTQTEVTYGAELNSSESGDISNGEDKLLHVLVKVLKLGCQYAWDDGNFNDILLFWRVFTANVNGFPVWYCLSCCGECGRDALSEFVTTVAYMISEKVCVPCRFNEKDLFLYYHAFWRNKILPAKTPLPNGEEVGLRNALKFLPQVGGDPRSWPIPDDVLKAVQCYSNWCMTEGAYANGFAGLGSDYPEPRSCFGDLPEINDDILAKWAEDTSCHGTKWTCCTCWIVMIRFCYNLYLSVKGFAPYSTENANKYLIVLTKLVRRDVIGLIALKHALFDKTLPEDGIASQKSTIGKILNNHDKDTLNGLVDLCRAITESKIVDDEIRQRLLAIKSQEGESIELLLYNKAPDILARLQDPNFDIVQIEEDISRS